MFRERICETSLKLWLHKVFTKAYHLTLSHFDLRNDPLVGSGICRNDLLVTRDNLRCLYTNVISFYLAVLVDCVQVGITALMRNIQHLTMQKFNIHIQRSMKTIIGYEVEF